MSCIYNTSGTSVNYGGRVNFGVAVYLTIRPAKTLNAFMAQPFPSRGWRPPKRLSDSTLPSRLVTTSVLAPGSLSVVVYGGVFRRVQPNGFTVVVDDPAVLSGTNGEK